MKKKKELYFIAGLLAILGGITAYAVLSQSGYGEPKEINIVKKEDPYGNIQKDKIDKVKTAKKAVDEVLSASEKELELKTTEANKAINDIGDETPELKAIQNAFRGIIEVANNPTIDHLQIARSYIANLSDANFSTYLEKQYEDTLISIVSNKTTKTKEEVKKETQPLTLEQVKEKLETNAKAEKAAKEKEDREIKEKAERERLEKEKAEQIATEQANSQTGTTLDKDHQEESEYTPPVNNSGGVSSNYTPPTNNGDIQNNQSIQEESDNDLSYYDQIHQNNPDLPADYDPTGGGTTGQDLGDLGPGWW